MKRPLYRWVEPESMTFDKQGKQIITPAHQEQGEYLDEADIPGYIIVLWNGKKHLVKETDVVAILS